MSCSGAPVTCCALVSALTEVAFKTGRAEVGVVMVEEKATTRCPWAHLSGCMHGAEYN